MTFSLGQAEGLEGRGPGRNRLGRRELLAGHDRRRHLDLLDRPHRLAGLAVEGEGQALLGGLDGHRHVLAVDVDVHEDGDVGQVVVPDRVVHGLEVPDAFTGLGVEGDGARAEQVVPRPEPAVVVDGRRVGGDVDDAPLEVGRHRRPRRDVAGPLPRVVLPGVEPELALGLGNDVELPLELPVAQVVAEDVARHVLDAALAVALLVGVADDDGVVDHDGGRRVGDVAQLGVEPAVGVVGVAEARQQVDDPGLGEPGDVHRRPEALDVVAGLGVERVQEERRGHDEDDPPPVDLGVGHALAVGGPHRLLPPLGVGLAVRPQRLAGARVHGHHRAPVAGHGVEDAVDIAGRRPRRVIGVRAVVVAPPDPRDLEVLEVPGVDLVDRREPGPPGIAALVPPLPVRRAPILLLGGRAGDRQGHRQQRDPREASGAPATSCLCSHPFPPNLGCRGCGHGTSPWGRTARPPRPRPVTAGRPYRVTSESR